MSFSHQTRSRRIFTDFKVLANDHKIFFPFETAVNICFVV